MTVEQWTCGNCGDTVGRGKSPNFVTDPNQPTPGVRIGVCDKCKRLLKETPEEPPT